MAAGNDAANALAELAEKFGRGVGSAEDLIDRNAARFKDVKAPSNKSLDEEATARLKSADPEALAKAVDSKDKALDVAVRGEGEVLVILENADGRAYKVHADLEEVEKHLKPKAAKKD